MENNPAPTSQVFTLENIEYSIGISIANDNIIISAKPIKSEFPFFYEFKSNLENLGKINKIFLIFDSLQEIKEFLDEFSSKKENISLLISNTNDDEEESITVNLKYNIGKISKIIKFNLTMIITDDKKMVKYLMKKLKESKIRSDKPKEPLFDSRLITDISQINLIKTGIKNLDSSKKIKLTLLFRASRDGDTISAFHKKVDGTSPTISLIQTKNDNFIFGGFTDHSWDSSSGCVFQTNNTFMFSFNKNKIYMGKNGGPIHCGGECGPWFCSGSGVHGDHYFNTNNSYQWDLSSNQIYWDGFTENFELVGGNRNFYVNEVEVFKIEYI